MRFLVILVPLLLALASPTQADDGRPYVVTISIESGDGALLQPGGILQAIGTNDPDRANAVVRGVVTVRTANSAPAEGVDIKVLRSQSAYGSTLAQAGWDAMAIPVYGTTDESGTLVFALMGPGARLPGLHTVQANVLIDGVGYEGSATTYRVHNPAQAVWP